MGNLSSERWKVVVMGQTLPDGSKYEQNCIVLAAEDPEQESILGFIGWTAYPEHVARVQLAARAPRMAAALELIADTAARLIRETAGFNYSLEVILNQAREALKEEPSDG